MTKQARLIGADCTAQPRDRSRTGADSIPNPDQHRQMSQPGIGLNSGYLGDVSLLFSQKTLLLPPQPKRSTREGLSILIRGCPGTGKTTLALQFASYLTQAINTSPLKSVLQPEESASSKGAYLSLEQHPLSLRQRLAGIILNQMRHAKDMQGSAKKVAQFWLPRCKAAAELARKVEAEERDAVVELVKDVALEIARENDAKSHLPLAFSLPEATRSSDSAAVFSESIEYALTVMSSLLKQDGDSKSAVFRWPTLVLDGLSVLPDEHRYVVTLDRLVERMKRLAAVSMLVYDPIDPEEADNLDHKADLVVELREHEIQHNVRYVTNEMCIHKSRYQNAAKGWHQYKLRDYGIETYPSVHFQVHQPDYMPSQFTKSLSPIAVASKKTASSGRESILECILGPIRDGSTVALLGGRGCFKTELTFDFLTAGVRPMGQKPLEPGLLLSLIDNVENLRTGIECPRIKYCDQVNQRGQSTCEECRKNLFLFHQRPGCITPSEFLYYVKKRLDHVNAGQRIRRLVFWDLTQIDHRFPMLTDDRMFLPALMDVFKFNVHPKGASKPLSGNPRELVTVFMGAGQASYTRAISAMADNVLFCWRDRLQNVGSTESPFENKEKAAELVKKYGDIGSEYLMIHIDRREIRTASRKATLYAFPVVDGNLALPAHVAAMDTFSVPEEKHGMLALTNDTLESIAEDQGIQRIGPRIDANCARSDQDHEPHNAPEEA
jgi:KaiC/GvpD/RAD55 family RecA-like ATPase